MVQRSRASSGNARCASRSPSSLNCRPTIIATSVAFAFSGAVGLIFEGGRAVGVSCHRRRGGVSDYRCGGEVLLALGTIATPQLLELSGIGIPRVLEDVQPFPIVASDLVELRRFVTKTETGVTFPPGDADAIKTVLDNLAEHRTRVDRMRAASERASRDYDWAREREKLVALYDRITSL